MSKAAVKKGAVPRLRFLGFAGEWAPKHLGEVCDMQAGKFVPAAHIQDVQRDGLYPCFGGNGLRGYTATYTHDGRLPLIGRQGALCGNVTFASGKFYATEHAVVASPKSDIAVNWLYYTLDRLNLNRFATGQAQPGLSVDVLEKVGCSKPTREEEQQKIANCLSSLDASIGAETRKLDALKSHRQGLMQQLFPTEGKRLPRLRFPGFVGAWKKTKADSLFSSRLEAGEKELPIYAVTMNDGMVMRSSIDRRVDDIADAKGNRKVHKGDIAYNMMRMWQGACGVAPTDCMVSPAYVILAPKPAVCSEFFGYLLKLPGTLRQLTAHSQGLTLDRLRLYYKDFATIPMLCPTLAEQQKIAACLSSIDDRIAAQSCKITALRQHKQGLMQGLFPIMDSHAA